MSRLRKHTNTECKEAQKTKEPKPDFKKEFLSTFNSVGYTKSRYDLFQDFLTMAYTAIAKTTALNEEEANKLEAEYMSVVKRYPKSELNIIREVMPKLMGLTQLGVLDSQDFLGSLFGELELGNKNIGQFFTPYTIAYFMAQLSLDEQIQKIKSGERKFFTLAEPASGAGGMILAAGNIIEENKLDPGMSMFFDATDVSDMAFKMTYIQCSLRGLSGLVRHGNTLSGEVFRVNLTPVAKLFYSVHGNPFKTKRKPRERENPRFKK